MRPVLTKTFSGSPVTVQLVCVLVFALVPIFYIS